MWNNNLMTSSLTRDKVMLQWDCAQRIKLDWIHCKVKVNKFRCYSLVRVSSFFSSHDAYTFIFLLTFSCIISLIPLLIQVLLSQRLLVASSVGINLIVHNFRVCFCVSSFYIRNGVFRTGPVKAAPPRAALFPGEISTCCHTYEWSTFIKMLSAKL